ncbi:MAG TPA: helix-turn-helix domain-containing protein [Anaerolineales bacterium]|nr:helix-turn-helix domain-containing protein [Anaerolineales bacterium]
MTLSSSTPNSFNSFGDLLKFLRRRQRLTQLELSIAVGYSESQITRLEKNQRLPDISAIKALFIPALQLENEVELTNYFLELAESARQEDAPAPGIAPYKGLLFFDDFDADLFFGRESLIATLTGHVIDLAAADSALRFLAVVGASGSGKSSLVRAGLAVALKRAGWDVRVFTPTATPLKILKTSMTAVQGKSSERVLILVDQFEEVFTLCRNETERIDFIDQLLSLAQEKSRINTVVIALRADFYSHCAQYPFLRQAVAAEQEYIGQMNREELRRAIEEPAKRGSWEFEPGLVELLLNDIGAQGSQEPEPGALPLLSHALLATWERRRGRLFTMEGYHASGGVRSAIAETAESIFTDQLNQNQQELAHYIFLRLTELGEGTEDTRRRAILNELMGQPEETIQLRGLLNTLAEARLITLNEDSAEVAHEALIREWSRLREWLTADREGLKLHRHLTESAHEWEALNKDVGALYRGARLAQAREWSEINSVRLSLSEQDFLSASVEQEQRELLEREALRQRELEATKELAETQRQSALRLRISNRVITAVAGVAVILAVLAGMLGLQSNRNSIAAQNNAARAQAEAETSATQRAIAEENFVRAENQQLAAQANRIISNPTGNSELAALLSIYSMRNGYIVNADTALAKAMLNLHTQFIIHPELATAGGATFSPDGTMIATGASDQTIELWDSKTGEFLRTLSKGPSGSYSSLPDLTFSPEGNWLFVRNNLGAIRLIDFETGETAQIFAIPIEHQVSHMAISPDGKMALGARVKSIFVWETLSGKIIRTFFTPDVVFDVKFSPDNQSILVGLTNGDTFLLDLTDGKPLQEYKHSSSRSVVAFSPDSQYVAIGQNNGEIYLHRTSTTELVRTFSGHQNAVLSLAFSPDGQSLISSSWDTTVRLWDVSTGQQLNIFSGHTRRVVKVEFSPDGTSALSSAEDGDVRVWRIRANTLDEHEPSARFMPNVRVVRSSDGQVMLVERNDEVNQTAMLNFIETETNKIFFSMEVPRLSYRRLSSDGKYILLNIAGESTYVTQIWDIQAGKLTLELNRNWAIFNAIFSPDNSAVVVAERDEVRLYLWEIPSGKLRPIWTWGETARGFFGDADSEALAWSPDGRYIAVGTQIGQTDIVDLRLSTRATWFGVPFNTPTTWVTAVAYSAAGDKIITGETSGKIRLWELATAKIVKEFNGHIDAVLSIKFSRDGKYILSASNDKTLRLWDLNTGKLVRVFHHVESVNYADFSSDGKFIIGSGANGAQLWDVDYQDTIQAACALLVRDFTPEERAQYDIPDDISTCPTK